MAVSRLDFGFTGLSASIVVGCVLVAGCGGGGESNDEQELRTAATQVVEGMVNHDVADLCRLIAVPQGLDTRAWAESCPNKVRQEYQSSNAVIPTRAEVISVSVDGAKGKAKVRFWFPSEPSLVQNLTFSSVNGNWLADSPY